MTDFTDPGYLRHCMRPDCDASFNIGEVYSGIAQAPGWRQVVQVADGYLCPRHAPAVASLAHLPHWVPAGPDTTPAIECACRWSWAPQADAPAVQGDYRDQWLAHLVQIDPQPAVA